MRSPHWAVAEILTAYTLVRAYKLSHSLSLEQRVSWEIGSIWTVEGFRYIFCVLFQMNQQIYLFGPVFPGQHY